MPITDPGYLTDFTGTVRRWLDAGDIDLGWDVNVTNSTSYVLTTPMMELANVGFTKRTPAKQSIWQVFEPFKPELWIMMLGSIFYGAAVLLALEHLGTAPLQQPQSANPRANLQTGTDGSNCARGAFDAAGTFCDRLYHAAAALLGSDEYEHVRLGNMARLYRLGLLFLVLTFSATYTANLAAFLTKPKFKVHGPRNAQELKQARACLRWPQYAPIHAQFVGSIEPAPPEVAPYRTAQENASHNVQDWSRAALREGKCDVIVEIEPSALKEQLRYCDTMHLADSRALGLFSSSVFSVLRAQDAALAVEISYFISFLRVSPQYRTVLENTISVGASCSSLVGASVEQKIGMWEMGGVFILFGASGVLAIAMAWAQRCRGARLRDPPGAANAVPKIADQDLHAKLNEVLARLDALGVGKGALSIAGQNKRMHL